jgi:preprotein translocase subunit SecD
MKCAVVFICLVAVAGCIGADKEPAKISLECRLVEESPAEGLTAMTMIAWATTKTLYVHDDVLMNIDDIASASAVSWHEHPAVELRFTDAGADKFAKITAANVGSVAVINGEFTEEEAKRVAAALRD